MIYFYEMTFMALITLYVEKMKEGDSQYYVERLFCCFLLAFLSNMYRECVKSTISGIASTARSIAGTATEAFR